ncbi:MAG: signal peptidase I [Oscillospiraceae bacterium]|nr:signal peptidase I [Oscillospiraceae bacterium]
MASHFRPPKPPPKGPLKPTVAPGGSMPPVMAPLDERTSHDTIDDKKTLEMLPDTPLPCPPEPEIAHAKTSEQEELSSLYVAIDYQMLNGRIKGGLIQIFRRFLFKSRISGILFYAVLALFLVVVGIFSGVGDDSPRYFFGFSALRVISDSMDSEIPMNSLIIIRSVDPDAVRVGDDITFTDSRNRTITHRVIEIIEDYEGIGERGFQTQGVDNIRPDREIVVPDTIAGRVVFHNLFLGRLSRFISQNAFLVSVFSILFVGLIVALKVFLLPGRGKLPQTPGLNLSNSFASKVE